MTSLQKDIFYILLQGGSISGSIKYGYRLKDLNGNPVLKFSHRTFHVLKPFLRARNVSFVLNKKHIRSLSKKYWIKQQYLLYLTKKTAVI